MPRSGRATRGGSTATSATDLRDARAWYGESMRAATLLVPAFLLGFGACVQVLGNDFHLGDGDAGGAGAAVGGSGGTATGGAGGIGGGSAGGGGAPACIEGFEAVATGCTGDPNGQSLQLVADDQMSALLGVQLYYGFGDPAPPPVGTPFGFDFYGEDYATCGVCAIIADQCDGAGTCQRWFIAQSGHLEVTTHEGIGGTFAGYLSDVVFAEVSIDPQTFHSEFVPNGATRCVPSFGFDSPITQ